MELLIMHRCAAPQLGAPHHRGDALFRLCPPGPQTGPRTPISAKLVANLITHAGANRVLTLDLHAGADPGLLRHPDRQPVSPVPVFTKRHQGATTTCN
jgi:hypothetical protein